MIDCKLFFLKATGLGSPGLALSSLGLDLPKAKAAVKKFKLVGASNCPVNFGGLSWDEAIERAARALKKARDENWIDSETINGESVKVQRTDAIGLIGGSQVNNEECYRLVKMFRSMGAMSLAAMSAAFGRGAMTNPWYDLKNTKLAWIEGSNLAECHPMGLKNLIKTKTNGLKIMHVDVRFTRTSKIADYFRAKFLINLLKAWFTSRDKIRWSPIRTSATFIAA